MKKEIKVVGALFEREGKILSVLRPLGKPQANYWEFPGGKLEAGEEAKEGLKREIREELGCEIEVGEVYAEISTEVEDKKIHFSLYCCKTEEDFQFFVHTAHVWIARESLFTLEWIPADLPILKKLAAEGK